MMQRASFILIVLLLLVACNDDGGPTTSTPPPPPAPQPVIDRFTLNAPDGFFQFSSPLATPTAGESVDIRFAPLAIHQGNSGFANAIEFWVDRGPQDNGIAMGFSWAGGDSWVVHTFTPVDGFELQPLGLFQIPVGGDLHTVTIRRGQGFTEWLLDGDSLVMMSRTRETIYTRVVGTRTRFEYEVPPDFLSTELPDTSLGLLSCGECQLHE